MQGKESERTPFLFSAFPSLVGPDETMKLLSSSGHNSWTGHVDAKLDSLIRVVEYASNLARDDNNIEQGCGPLVGTASNIIDMLSDQEV